MKYNRKAAITGVAVGLAAFVGTLFIGASHRSAPAQPGSVTVRQIRNQDGGQRAVIALGFGVVVGFGAYWVARRRSVKSDKNERV